MLIPIQDLGRYGIVRDAFAHDLPLGAWSDGRNVRFADGYVERIKGHQTIFGAPTVTPYILQPYYSGSTRYWVYGGSQKLYSVTGSTHTNITRQSAGVDVNYTATPNTWTSTVMGGIAYLNNGTDVPQSWAGSGKSTDLTNWPSTLRCKALRNFKSALIAMNCTESGTNYPHMVRTSHPADPGSVPASWDYTDNTKDCVRTNLPATQDVLIDGATLGDYFYLYKETSIYRMQYIGAPDIFRFSDALSTQAGAIAANCIAEFPGGHLVLGQGDIFIFNGSTVQSAINGRMRRWLQANIDSQYYYRSFISAQPQKSEILVCIPTMGASLPNLALIWNWESNAWTFREIPSLYHANFGVVDATATDSIDSMTGTIDSYTDPINYTDFTQASNRLLMAGSSIYMADSTRLFDGSNYTAYVARTGMTFPGLADDRMKLISQVFPRFEGAGTVNVYVGGSNELNGAVTWSTPKQFVIGTDTKVDTIDSLAWRWSAIKFESTEQATWRLPSFDVDVIDMGRW